MLKHLELSGFKSFVKKDVLDFSTPITAIVGPNGSGKSNVAEAFRFVLGEQSIKSLRGKRGEDLIWNGTKEVPRSSQASVSIVFDNSRQRLAVDFEEVVIKRVVRRDGVNQYYINNSLVRLKDIIELLSGANVGASGHHIISQGEADRILNASTRERREMIEDALGLKIFLYRREESVRKLNKTEENISQVQSLRREISPHLKFLKSQVEKIEKSRKQREKLAVYYREYLKREELYVTHHLERLRNDLKNPREQLREVEKDLARTKKILEGKEKRSTEGDKIVTLERDLSILRERKGLTVRNAGRIEGQIAFEETRIMRDEERARDEEARTVAVRDIEEIVRSAEDVASGVRNATESDEIRRALGKIMHILKSFISRISIRARDSVEEIDKKVLSDLKQNKEEIDKELEEISKREEELNDMHRELRKIISAASHEGREAEIALMEGMGRQNEVRALIMQLESEESEIKRAREELDRDISEAVVLLGTKARDFHAADTEDSDVLILAEDRKVQEARRKEIERMKIRLEDSGQVSGEEILREYKDVEDRDGFLEREITDLEKSAQSLKDLIKELEEKLNEKFKDGVERINKEFQHFFALMFGGGNASLSVVARRRLKKKEEGDIYESMEEESETEEGLEVNISLPRKRIKGLMMLSGGERALTSIALLFALSRVNPPPFLVLDETDAALDEANSRRYGDMIEDLSKHSQLILITHNRETMGRAGVLYGVTMGGDGVSKLLSVKFDEAVRVAK